MNTIGGFLPLPDLFALQIEPSTYCTLRCPTCPRTAFAGYWHNAHFPLDQLDKLLPLAAKAELVILQGWGEPLCHPELAMMVQKLTAAGARCAVTTNGCLLDEKRGAALLAAGLSDLTVSISGARPETHAALRPPSDLDALMSRVRRFRALAEEMGKPVRVTVSFLQQDENIDELPAVLALAAENGLDQCLAVNATYLPTPEHRKQYVKPSLRASWASGRALWRSIWLGQEYIAAKIHEREQDVCANDPLRCLAIGADGSLSPCLFLQLPLRGTPPGVPPLLVMGNVFRQDFLEIWESSIYRQFRRYFGFRRDFFNQLYEEINHCSDAQTRKAKVQELSAKMKEVLAQNPAPAVCRTCAKLCGL